MATISNFFVALPIILMVSNQIIFRSVSSKILGFSKIVLSVYSLFYNYSLFSRYVYSS